MSALDDSKLAVLSTLIDAAPDSAIRSLDRALSGEAAGGPMASIRDMVSAEAFERRARNMVFAPILRLCPAGPPAIEHQVFPRSTVKLLWQALHAERPDEVSAAMDACRYWRSGASDPRALDLVCEIAAEGLRAPRGAFVQVVAKLEAERAGCAAALAGFLDLSPLARRALGQLGDWLARMSDERAAGARIVFRDADAAAPDGAQRLFEILLAQLDEPWQILRLLRAVILRPNDSYVAASELGFVGERLLDQVDGRILKVRAFDPQHGAEAGRAVAEAARLATLTLIEFEQSLDLGRDGPWGSRVAAQKLALAEAMELRFKKAEDAVAAALPLKPVRHGARFRRGVPRLTTDPDPRLAWRAESYLVLLEAARSSAPTAGYAASRAKLLERIDARIDQYIEDVIEHLRGDEVEEPQRARAYVDVAARLVAIIRGEKAAQLVRRRAAA